MTKRILVGVWLTTLAALAVGGIGGEAKSNWRKWSDSTGKYSVLAEFVGIKGGKVCLKKENGEVVSISPERLSAADREFIEKVQGAAKQRPVGDGRTISCRLRHLTISPDHRTLAAVVDSSVNQWSYELKLLSAKTGQPLATLPDYFGSGDWDMHEVAFSSDGRQVFANARGRKEGGAYDRRGAAWDARTGKLLPTAYPPVNEHRPPGYSVIRLPAFDDQTSQIRIAGLAAKRGFEPPSAATALSADGKYSANAIGNRVTLMEVHTQKALSVLNSAGSVGVVLFSPDGKTLVTASRENGIEVWDVKAARKRHTFELEKQATYPFRALILVSPDSKTLVSVAPGKGTRWGGEAKVWDLRTGELLGTVGGRSNVCCVAFSPNSSILAAGCETSEVSIRLLDARTGKDLTGLKGHTGPVKAVFFLPDGKTLISGSTDGTIRWWDIAAL